ncbi:Retrovirus-related Pol polyprotein from transposon 17.6 [Cucumis melo var. makuwa]|uniref:Retrovirus-related Pol polyprotein from transposon 17.6 n=1 Tax=Cucumis melo var. makuwa TaxID=1194695 RepID=A0A5D3BI90_CUCMM|nr:Retrovirus-related Pol polyprotein from transposon 17.6 [Cucumis melo var. makuwa]TYJ98764.1 Retrovirus-related Pol polyprotein from transposon 17.6 [Cucumis melo var. makuwa]
MVLKRCKETQLILNWEKCHFMETKEILLGHEIAYVGLEVDPTKIDVVMPILITLDWSYAFELICDASDVAIAAMLDQKKDKVIYPIYYTSKP